MATASGVTWMERRLLFRFRRAGIRDHRIQRVPTAVRSDLGRLGAQHASSPCARARADAKPPLRPRVVVGRSRQVPQFHADPLCMASPCQRTTPSHLACQQPACAYPAAYGLALSATPIISGPRRAAFRCCCVQCQFTKQPREGQSTVAFDGDGWVGFQYAVTIGHGDAVPHNLLSCLFTAIPSLRSLHKEAEMKAF